jgi:uncharacterized cupin superfamily protein
MSTLDPLTVKPRVGTNYPAQYAGVVEGREKRVLGDMFGLTQFGVNLTTLAPGSSSALRHWHEQEDEFVFVVSGEVTLIDNSGEHVLTEGKCAGFKAGVANGHHLVNKTDRPAVYLEIGTRSPDEVAHYPEADMKGIKTGGKYLMTKKDGSSF